jgi:hypothetical protein
LLNYIIAGCFTFQTNQSFHHDDDNVICAHSFCKLLEIWKERFMNFELGMGKMHFVSKKRFMEFELGIRIGRNLENGIYEF